MDGVFQALLSWQFLFFCLSIGAIVFVIRQVVEYWMENGWPLKQWNAANKESKVWRGLILPILPILLGLTIGLLDKQYAYPEGFNTSSGRVVFGLVAGFTSSFVVRALKQFLGDKAQDTNTDVSNDDVPKRGQL